jgi:hypothetical protein
MWDDAKVTVLEFIATLVRALAWPAVVVFLLYLFRNQVTALADRLKSASFGGASAEFNALSEQAQGNLDDAAQDLALGTLKPSSERSGREPAEDAEAEQDDRQRELLARWRHPGLTGRLTQRAQELIAERAELPPLDPPSLVWYSVGDPAAGAQQIMASLEAWLAATAYMLGEPDNLTPEDATRQLCSLGKLDAETMLATLSDIRSMANLLARTRFIDVKTNELARLARIADEFARTLWAAVRPGIDVLESIYRGLAEEAGEREADALSGG